MLPSSAFANIVGVGNSNMILVMRMVPRIFLPDELIISTKKIVKEKEFVFYWEMNWLSATTLYTSRYTYQLFLNLEDWVLQKYVLGLL